MTPVRPPDQHATEGTLIDRRYQVLQVLGSGGAARTYLVLDRVRERRLALKLVTAGSPSLLDRLGCEFRLLRELRHPHLVEVLDFARLGRDLEAPLGAYYTAEVVSGRALSELLAGPSYPRWMELRRILADALSALRYLHQAGLCHGDFTPANIIVRSDGRGVLIDLSCGSAIGTRLGSVSGTPGYLAPETLLGERTDQRTDLYAVGVTLTRMVERVGAEVDSRIRELALRLVATDPARRGADVDDVLEALGAEVSTLPSVPVGLGGFVEREPELRQIRGALDALVAGKPGPRAIGIEGAEGAGKTRFLQELRWEASGRCITLDANTTATNAIPQLLAHALELASLPNDLDSVLEAGDRLRANRAPPLVLMLDDVDRLTEQQSSFLSALLRAVEATDPLLLVVSSSEPAQLPAADALRVVLRPLSLTALREWMGSALPPTTVKDLWKLSGGHPRAVRGLLTELVAGTLSVQELHDGTAGIRLSARRRERTRALSDEARSTLGMIALLEPGLVEHAWRQWRPLPQTKQELLNQGLVVRDRLGLGLARPGEAQALLEALEPSLVQALHRRFATWLAALQSTGAEADQCQRAELAAAEVRHLALSGQIAAAQQRLDDTQPLQEVAPRAWRRAVTALCRVEAGFSPGARGGLELALARLERLTGAVRGSQERLRRLVAQLPEGKLADDVTLELATGMLQLGEVGEAEGKLARICERGTDPSGWAASVLAQSLLKRGSYREAAEVASLGLETAGEPRARAMLLQTLGISHSFLGEPELALRKLEEASELVRASDCPRQIIRLNGARAIVAYELGDLIQAAQHHAEALALAERHGLFDQVATALLNLGTVRHQQGDWGAALACYERGQRLALGLGQARTLALLRFNLAKLYVDLWLVERAERAAELCAAEAHRAHLPLVAAEAEAVLGELELHQKHWGSARSHLLAAREVVAKHASAREQLELELQLAELDLLAGDLDLAARSLQESLRQAEQLRAQDVRIRCDLLRGRLALSQGQPRLACQILEDAAERAGESGVEDLRAESDWCLSLAYSELGSTTLAEQHRLGARARWERTAATLGPSLRESFWRHPKRSALAAPAAEVRRPASYREQKLELLLEINKRLNSSLSTQAVIERAIDAALELTQAERGFVLLLDGSGAKTQFRVAAARRLDRSLLERVAPGPPAAPEGEPRAEDHCRFSRAIAESVVREGVPIVTANALQDERFRQQRSVHALQLKSVLCVPVSSPEAPLGALYLDSRLEQHRFDEQDVRLLLAFADQVALALHNARLHADLAQRNRELCRHRREVEELARNQAAEIARLAQEVEERRRRLEHRYDYTAMIGSSPAMQRVFALLDRVIETDLPVLIEGESGTGKELVARAIHQNDARRRGRLVSINCAAVPDNLLESELFGYERGAFTGADRSREGLLVQARGGTVFLDEVGEMQSAMQTRLLRVIQERELRPLGSDRVISVDLRWVCATNRHLRDEVAAGRFREDLYYRISGVEITLPPLRQRQEDIPALIRHFLTLAVERLGRPVPELTRQALEALTRARWPGNVRQLEHVVTRAVALSDTSRLGIADFDLQEAPNPQHCLDRQVFERNEAAEIARALSLHRFNVSKVARVLGIPRATLCRKLKRYGLTRTAPGG
ncbi:MAG: sigma 54-interacting transcriptional regulator [Polyangiaceae bacterium]|nr:sigma 54-interacting transcriptional regulator [Polyangiaceae bacterium]